MGKKINFGKSAIDLIRQAGKTVTVRRKTQNRFPKDYTIVGATIYIKRRYGCATARQEINITFKPGIYVRSLEVDLGKVRGMTDLENKKANPKTD